MYDGWAYAVHGFQAYITHVETARNDAALASTGCLKETKVDKLRALVGVRSMRGIGKKELHWSWRSPLEWTRTPRSPSVARHGFRPVRWEKKVEGNERRFQDDRLTRASKWFPTRGIPSKDGDCRCGSRLYIGMDFRLAAGLHFLQL